MPASVIRVATDFSRYPAGRYSDDGPFSGEAFRENLLLPQLRSGSTVTVVLDGVRGYGSSFLEEAFGGLVRAGFSTKELKERIVLNSKDPSLLEEITEYIERGVSADTP